MRWNGSTWWRVPSPGPGHDVYSLSGVAVATARSAWAVGTIAGATGIGILLLHWNGVRWTQQRTVPGPAGSDLDDVAASSRASAWAVGEDLASMAVPLLYHWNGRTWKLARDPLSDVYNYLTEPTTPRTSAARL
jgi:hypothetical protein